MVQWLRLHTPNAGGPGSSPGQGTKSHMPQLRVHMPQLKIRGHFPGGPVVKNPPSRDFSGGVVVKNLPANDTGSTPGPERSHMPQSN